jgi:hypothetical protein
VKVTNGTVLNTLLHDSAVRGKWSLKGIHTTVLAAATISSNPARSAGLGPVVGRG